MNAIDKIKVEIGSGNVFLDIGFSPAEAEAMSSKCNLIFAISDTIRRRKLTNKTAARICRTRQATLSNVLRGRNLDVTLDDLISWLIALGRTVEIRIRPYNAKAKTGQLVTVG